MSLPLESPLAWRLSPCTWQHFLPPALITSSSPLSPAPQVLGVHMPKAKSVSRSNWSSRLLTLQQIKYAALDVFAAGQVRVFSALGGQDAEGWVGAWVGG